MTHSFKFCVFLLFFLEQVFINKMNGTKCPSILVKGDSQSLFFGEVASYCLLLV